jgi:hypothetical protein
MHTSDMSRQMWGLLWGNSLTFDDTIENRLDLRQFRKRHNRLLRSAVVDGRLQITRASREDEDSWVENKLRRKHVVY